MIARSKRLFGGRGIKVASDVGHGSLGSTLFRAAFGLMAPAAVLVGWAAGSRDAAADSGTRSLTFLHTHTRETATITFRRGGQYDSQALTQLNWFLRDWRVNEPAKMDPLLFDILWEVYRESGSSQPINIVSAYRSPETNGALRRRSKGVSEHSQHMLGKAMDVRLPDVDTGRLRAIAMRMQYGGVGYYPSSSFVHIDTGNVRAWPRMTQDQLARLFPDGKTLHLPSNGRPLAGYEQAKAEILARNASLASQASAGSGPSLGGIVAKLFGRKDPPQADSPTLEPATTLAYASPEALEPVRPLPPLPPQRPREQFASAQGDIVPEQMQDETAAGTPAVWQTVAAEPLVTIGLDTQSAVRALFDPRTPLVAVGFTATIGDELNTTQFSGPAVKPLPVQRQAQADL